MLRQYSVIDDRVQVPPEWWCTRQEIYGTVVEVGWGQRCSSGFTEDLAEIMVLRWHPGEFRWRAAAGRVKWSWGLLKPPLMTGGAPLQNGPKLPSWCVDKLWRQNHGYPRISARQEDLRMWNWTMRTRKQQVNRWGLMGGGYTDISPRVNENSQGVRRRWPWSLGKDLWLLGGDRADTHQGLPNDWWALVFAGQLEK